MASFIRSISVKIFGVSLCLLAIMTAAALWSANLTSQVNMQLRTLNYSLFPLALTVSELDTSTLAQEMHTKTGLETPDQAAANSCLVVAADRAAETAKLIDRAEESRAVGARIAVLERTKLMMARLEPMIAGLKNQEDHLNQAIKAGCDLHASPAVMQQARDQAEEVRRITHGIAQEIRKFVAEGAALVGNNQQRAMQANQFTIASAALVGLMLAWLVSRGLTRPIIKLQAGARAVSAGMLDVAQVPVTSRDEIGDVTLAFNTMVNDLREKERIKEAFGQYVDPRIVAGLIGSGSYLTEGEKQVATLFFSDVIGFTSIAERLAPGTLVKLINAYFSEMSIPIRESSGVIDKYMGDGIMAFWVPPFVDANTQARLACAAALEQRARLNGFRERVPDLIGLRRDIPMIDFRVGLASGEVVVGSVGSSQACSFTVMGDTVNFASRLEAANKVYGTRILIDHATFRMAGEAIEAREIDCITVVGRTEPMHIYELRAMAGNLTPDDRVLFNLYGDALAFYRDGKWGRAADALLEALSVAPEDGPSQTMLKRVMQLQEAEPEDWDGVWRLTSK